MTATLAARMDASKTVYQSSRFAIAPIIQFPITSPVSAQSTEIVVDAWRLRKVARKVSWAQEQVAAEGAPLRVLYGRTRIGAQVAVLHQSDTTLYLLCVWGEGPIDAVEAVEINNKAVPASVTVTTYLGTTGQTVNATLAGVIPGYADALPGIAYSVLQIPLRVVDGFPEVAAIVRGRKLYDPRLDSTVAGGSGSHRRADPATWAYSANPSLALADFLADATYGAGVAVSWTSVQTAANENDETISGEARRVIGLTLEQPEAAEAWAEALRAYAGVFLFQGADGVELIPDTTGSSDLTCDADNIVAGSFEWRRRSARDTPTVIEVAYSETGASPWREAVAVAKAAGVEGGSVSRRVSRFALPGITRYSQAYREAVERLNHLTLENLEAQFVVVDEGLTLKLGSLVTVTHTTLGISSKLMRVTALRTAGPGRWRVAAVEYDPAVYSDAVVATPSYPDTTLQSPLIVSAPTAVNATEEAFQFEAWGQWAARAAVTWTAPAYQFTDHFRIELLDSGVVIETAVVQATTTTWRSGALVEGRSYQVLVYTVSTLGLMSTAASDDLTVTGKTTPPANVSSFRAFEAGGTVYMYWSAVADADVRYYEIRYGSTGGSWATAAMLDRQTKLSYQTNQLPAGTWRVYVAALDASGNYSATPSYQDVTVTLDASAFASETHTFTAPTLTSMTAYTAGGASYWATDFGDGWGYGHDNTDNAVGTWNDSLLNVVWAHPHTSGTSKWESEYWDYGATVSGTVTATWDVTAVSGSVLYEIGYATTDPGNSGSWTWYSGTSTKLTGRYWKVRATCDTSETFIVNGEPTLRLDLIPRKETGNVTTAGGTYATVNLAGYYVSAKTIQLTAKANSGAAVICVYDNVTLSPSSANSFRVYTFDAAGAAVNVEVQYLFEGI
jgi:hypothetical protein